MLCSRLGIHIRHTEELMGLISIVCHRLADSELHDSTKKCHNFILPAHTELFQRHLYSSWNSDSFKQQYKAIGDILSFL